MRSAPAIIVSGALAYDDTYLYAGRIKEHMPRNPTDPLYLNLRAHGPEQSHGGCGGNVVYNLSLLKTHPRIHAWVGRDGRQYLAELRRRGVDVSGVLIVTNVFTSRAVLLADATGDQILFFGEPEAPVRLPAPDLQSYALAVATAGSPVPSLEFLAACRASGIPTVIDPGKLIMDVDPEALREGITGADSIVLNEYEYHLLLRRLDMTASDLASRVTTLVVTRGSDGIRVMSDGTQETIPPVALAAVADPSGAGDAFLAGFSFGRYNGFSAAWSARIGAVTASFALEVPGTQNHAWSPAAFAGRLAAAYGEPEKALPF